MKLETMTAHSTKACKAKARLLQNLVAEKLQELFRLGPDDIKPALMGEQGMDIKLSSRMRSLFPYAIECKSQEKIDLWAALQQAEVNAKKENLAPLLVFKRSRSKVYVAIEITDFLEIVMRSLCPKP